MGNGRMKVPFIHLKKIFTECLLCTRNCCRCWVKVMNKKDKNYVLMDKNHSKREVNNKQNVVCQCQELSENLAGIKLYIYCLGTHRIKILPFDLLTALVSGFDSLTCLRRANTKSGKSRNEKGTMSPGWWLLRTEER